MRVCFWEQDNRPRNPISSPGPIVLQRGWKILHEEQRAHRVRKIYQITHSLIHLTFRKIKFQNQVEMLIFIVGG